jgi:hypothetical protein
VRTAAFEGSVDPSAPPSENHRRSPRAYASEDTVHLENDALAIEDLEDRRWEEKVSRGGRRIRRGDIAAGVSAATKSESGVEEIQGQDRRSAGASQ